jgi:ParB-like chromosome segregation protein Spo0J
MAYFRHKIAKEEKMEQGGLFDEIKKESHSIKVEGFDIDHIKDLPLDQKVDAINELKKQLHEISPFKNEPVDCVLWIKNDDVYANDYNPNNVAPPEMELLRVSINNDGYTQPIVTMQDEKGQREVIDGFHRNRVGKECEDIQKRVQGYLPVVAIRDTQTDRNDRIASTIRHNRARGKHQVDAMSDIVIELKKRNWSDKKIGRELGMDEDEVLRLCQISGLTDVFSDEQFTMSWDIDIKNEEDIEIEFDEVVGQKDKKRIYHTFDKWECQKSGFYSNKPPKDMTKEEAEIAYASFLSDIPLFEKTLEKVIVEWKYSCEHYLSNESMNRIAWLGQASLCHHLNIPSCFRSGWNLLPEAKQLKADQTALKYLNIWLKANERAELTLAEAQSKTQADLY